MNVQAPIIPLILHDGDTRNFDMYQEVDLQMLQPSSDEDLALFLDFWPASSDSDASKGLLRQFLL